MSTSSIQQDDSITSTNVYENQDLQFAKNKTQWRTVRLVSHETITHDPANKCSRMSLWINLNSAHPILVAFEYISDQYTSVNLFDPYIHI